jgi:predicted small lipoprotein YifL
MMISKHIVWLIVPATLLAACGQKGPLYLEGHEPPAERRAAEAAKKEAAAQSGQQAPASK